MNKFQSEIINLFEKENLKDIILEVPPKPDLGDFAVPCFHFAKMMKKAPNMIAQELAKSFNSDLFEKITATGPYVNFFVDSKKYIELVLKNINNDFGSSSKKDNEKVMIEFSSPNTNKPLHLGHIRNILLGESNSRIFEKVGKKVTRACIVNDRGVHICKSMLAYQKWGNNAEPNKKSDHFVGDWYVKFDVENKKNPELEKEAQEMLVKWEDKDPDVILLWKKMNKWVLDGFEETYKIIGIKFDSIYYESKFYDKGKEIAEKGLKEGILKKDEKGNVVAPLSKMGFENDKVLLRADGTTVYMTQDVYLAKKKIDDFKLDKSFYVVASEQNMHFKQLFNIIDLLNVSKTEAMHHISYGMVNLPDGKMKSREGTVVDADELIKDVINLAKKEIKERYKDLTDQELNQRAEMIGMGAIKFFILKMDPIKDMTYNPKESVSFEGETGPYVQYVYARINSIFEKGEITSINNTIDFGLYDDLEKQITKKLESFPIMIEDAATHFKPSTICRYLLTLSQMFSEYYHSHQILKETDEIKNARLFLLDKIRITIKNGLELLGIDAPERM